MNQQDWVEKFKAIRALSPLDTGLFMRNDGSWYFLQHGVERKEGGCSSSGYEAGSCPEQATHQRWAWLTNPKYYLVLNSSRENRRAVRWNSFMWEDVVEEKRVD
jgi:hypothetical protein